MDDSFDAESYPSRTRIYDAEYLKYIQDETDKGVYDLSPGERWWTDRYHYLDSRGYRLRARYKPGWTPSWKGTNIDPDYCPDSHSLWFPQVIDAYRISDGAAVAIKKVRKSSDEIKIHTRLTSPERLQDPRNHCVPLLECLEDNLEQNIELIVMPHLLHLFRLDFHTVGEVVDFMQQSLEALAYIHSQGVAHRDYSVNNILLDGTPLHPNGYLPADPFYDRTGQKAAVRLRRSEVPSVRYYVIDFGISTHFEDSTSPLFVTGTFAQDQDVPELSETVPYDPFKVDVFTLGNVFKKYFIEDFTNLNFIYPLVEQMTYEDPTLRPTTEEAYSRFRRIVSRKKGTSLRWRLQKPDEKLGASLRSDLTCVVQEFKIFARYLVSRPLVLASLLIIVAGATLSRTLGRDAVFARISQIFSRLRVRR